VYFKDFDEAVKKCLACEGCSGITKTTGGYSLRVGKKLLINPERDRKSGLASWVKESLPDIHDLNTSEQKKEKKEEKKSEKKKKKKNRIFNNITKKEPEPKVACNACEWCYVIMTEENTKRVDTGLGDEKLVCKKCVEEAEAQKKEMEASEDEEDELDVDEIMIEGKKYFYDCENNDIYDPNTAKIVGYKNGKDEYVLN
jgi:hypothetical protein